MDISVSNLSKITGFGEIKNKRLRAGVYYKPIKKHKIMTIKTINGFFPFYKLHKVCADDNMRPMYNYIFFRNGKAYATNAYTAIVAPLSFVSTFSVEEQKLLEGKLIHATQFAELLKMCGTYVKEVSDGVIFACTTKSGQSVVFPLINEDACGKYPNVDVVVEKAIENVKESKQPLSCIGFHPSLLADLASAMDAESIQFYFSDASHAIIVRDADICNEICAVLMPTLIDNPYY